MHAHEVQPRHYRAGTVLLPGEAHLVERIREPDPPRVVGPEARCEDDGPETRELQSLGGSAWNGAGGGISGAAIPRAEHEVRMSPHASALRASPNPTESARSDAKYATPSSAPSK